MSAPSLNHNEHGSRRSRSGGFPNVRQRYASIHVHGGHDRVVPYDPDINGRAVSPSRQSLTFTDPSLPTSRPLGVGILLIPSLAPRRPLTVSSRGRVFGFLSLNIRHKFLSRCRPVSLRNEAFKPIRRRSDYTAKYLSAVPHNHRQPAPFQASRLSCSPTWQGERTKTWERQPITTGREK